MKYINKYLLPGIILLLLAYTAKINWSKGQWEHVIEADGKGYYAYLPAIFIYHDLNFGFFRQVEIDNAYDKTIFYEYRQTYKGQIINKCYIGVAVCMAPFFLTAHGLSYIFGFPADGYSQLYVIFLTIAALFYLYFGLFFLKKTLQLYGFSDMNIIILILCILFGTNLFYYSIGEVSMTHVYSFSLFSFFIYHIKRYFQSAENRNILYASVALGLIILIRPANGLIILGIPFLSNDYNTFKEVIRKYQEKNQVLYLSLFFIIAIPCIQLIVYKIQTGDFLVYSYRGEGFDFKNPHFIDFLFSYRKGYFLYTPISFLALLGLIPLYRNKFQFFSITFFFLVLVYILSSWKNWYYGGSFSSRVMVEYLPFTAILLGAFLQYLSNRKLKFLFIALFGILILFNQFQTLQYRYYIIHWSEMNKKKYWKTFLSLKPILERRAEVKKDSNQGK